MCIVFIYLCLKWCKYFVCVNIINNLIDEQNCVESYVYIYVLYIKLIVYF